MIADGSLPQLMQETLGALQPEAVYFGAERGVRTAWIVFDLKDPSQLPSITEPLYSKLKANIQMFPVMNGRTFRRGSSRSAEADRERTHATTTNRRQGSCSHR